MNAKDLLHKGAEPQELVSQELGGGVGVKNVRENKAEIPPQAKNVVGGSMKNLFDRRICHQGREFRDLRNAQWVQDIRVLIRRYLDKTDLLEIVIQAVASMSIARRGAGIRDSSMLLKRSAVEITVYRGVECAAAPSLGKTSIYLYRLTESGRKREPGTLGRSQNTGVRIKAEVQSSGFLLLTSSVESQSTPPILPLPSYLNAEECPD